MTDNTQHTFLTPLTDRLLRLYQRLLQLLGRQPDKLAEPVRLLTDLCLARASQRAQRYAEMALPESLLQAFSSEALTPGDERFTGREEQLTHLLTVIEMWRAGRSPMVAVTGPQGCGITSLLQQLMHRVNGDTPCRYGKLERRPYDTGDTLALLGTLVGCEQAVDSVEALIEYINNLDPGIFIIDNGQFLACRILGANEAIRLFGAVMLATQQRHLWVLGCPEYAWRRLTYIYRADRYFSDRVELALFTETELGECLTKRLQLANITLNDEQSGDDSPMPAMLTRHLPTLYKLSNGKADFAFFYFLSSLQINDENRALDIQAVVAQDFSTLKQLISEELFSLAEVAAHGQLSISDHRTLFRLSHEESLLLLERLYHQCLLDRDGSNSEATYRLVPLYSDVITRHLTNTNHLY